MAAAFLPSAAVAAKPAFNALNYASGSCISASRSFNLKAAHQAAVDGPKAFFGRRKFEVAPQQINIITFSVSAATALDQDTLKRLAAEKAVEKYFRSGMVVGLGTGSTAAYAVAHVGKLMKEGKLKDIVAIPTSIRTAEQAESLGIPLVTLDTHPNIDVAIDGSDEVDPVLNLVKGRGGALLREKMVELQSGKFIVIVDETKLVAGLGISGAMPVEVVQFCWEFNLKRIQDLFGCEAKRRENPDGTPYVTDNSNYIIDLYFSEPIPDPYGAASTLKSYVGVVDHGLFLDMATSIVVAGSDGVYEMKRTNPKIPDSAITTEYME